MSGVDTLIDDDDCNHANSSLVSTWTLFVVMTSPSAPRTNVCRVNSLERRRSGSPPIIWQLRLLVLWAWKPSDTVSVERKPAQE